ncbi:ribbon-helix-helix protein, CopG family [Halorussus sp. AFM4]|uniref:ribbon-helix-helix protein, CopG family n=1 Tax=Halorussus sp. AFM4 TaxID=3421651 RepID=UPI003EBFC613
MSKTKSCRLPESTAALLEQAAEERGRLQSELIRTAIRYYIINNPDDNPVFAQQASDGRRRRPKR